jgi:hypothetical protein
MCVHPDRDLLRVKAVAVSPHAPPFVVSDNASHSVVLGARGALDLLVTAEVFRGTAEAEFGATNVQGAFGAVRELAIAAWIAFSAAITPGYADIICTV